MKTPLSLYMCVLGTWDQNQTCGCVVCFRSLHTWGQKAPPFLSRFVSTEINSNILPLDRKVNKHHKPILNRNNTTKVRCCNGQKVPLNLNTYSTPFYLE